MYDDNNLFGDWTIGDKRFVWGIILLFILVIVIVTPIAVKAQNITINVTTKDNNPCGDIYDYTKELEKNNFFTDEIYIPVDVETFSILIIGRGGDGEEKQIPQYGGNGGGGGGFTYLNNMNVKCPTILSLEVTNISITLRMDNIIKLIVNNGQDGVDGGIGGTAFGGDVNGTGGNGTVITSSSGGGGGGGSGGNSGGGGTSANGDSGNNGEDGQDIDGGNGGLESGNGLAGGSAGGGGAGILYNSISNVFSVSGVQLGGVGGSISGDSGLGGKGSGIDGQDGGLTGIGGGGGKYGGGGAGGGDEIGSSAGLGGDGVIVVHFR